MHLSFPFRFDSRGLTAEAPDDDAYIRELEALVAEFLAEIDERVAKLQALYRQAEAA